MLARAFHAAGNGAKRDVHLAAARDIAQTLDDDEERKVLEDGLNEIG